jgi:ribosomal silencing factor RsfS
MMMMILAQSRYERQVSHVTYHARSAKSKAKFSVLNNIMAEQSALSWAMVDCLFVMTLRMTTAVQTRL